MRKIWLLRKERSHQLEIEAQWIRLLLIGPFNQLIFPAEEVLLKLGCACQKEQMRLPRAGKPGDDTQTVFDQSFVFKRVFAGWVFHGLFLQR